MEETAADVIVLLSTDLPKSQPFPSQHFSFTNTYVNWKLVDLNVQCCFHTTHVFNISSKLRCSLKRVSVTSSITIFRSISSQIASRRWSKMRSRFCLRMAISSGVRLLFRFFDMVVAFALAKARHILICSSNITLLFVISTDGLFLGLSFHSHHCWGRWNYIPWNFVV